MISWPNPRRNEGPAACTCTHTHTVKRPWTAAILRPGHPSFWDASRRAIPKPKTPTRSLGLWLKCVRRPGRAGHDFLAKSSPERGPSRLYMHTHSKTAVDGRDSAARSPFFLRRFPARDRRTEGADAFCGSSARMPAKTMPSRSRFLGEIHAGKRALRASA